MRGQRRTRGLESWTERKVAIRHGRMRATQERALWGGPPGEGRGVCSQKAQEAVRLGWPSSGGPGTRAWAPPGGPVGLGRV